MSLAGSPPPETAVNREPGRMPNAIALRGTLNQSPFLGGLCYDIFAL
jgi:hypothetical protein